MPNNQADFWSSVADRYDPVVDWQIGGTEMRRILRPGGLLIIANLDVPALNPVNRIRSLMRVVRTVVRHRLKPPKGFGRNILSEAQLRQLLERCGFRVDSAETIRDPSHSSNVPVDYVHAVKTEGECGSSCREQAS